MKSRKPKHAEEMKRWHALAEKVAEVRRLMELHGATTLEELEVKLRRLAKRAAEKQVEDYPTEPRDTNDESWWG